MKVSNCCGADGSYSFMVAWATYEDAELCPKCGEHCEYVEEEPKDRKCYNCKHASPGFKISGQTHHQCNHPKHEEGFKSGDLSPWDTLQEFYNTCESHEFRRATTDETDLNTINTENEQRTDEDA